MGCVVGPHNEPKWLKEAFDSGKVIDVTGMIWDEIIALRTEKEEEPKEEQK